MLFLTSSLCRPGYTCLGRRAAIVFLFRLLRLTRRFFSPLTRVYTSGRGQHRLGFFSSGLRSIVCTYSINKDLDLFSVPAGDRAYRNIARCRARDPKAGHSRSRGRWSETHAETTAGGRAFLFNAAPFICGDRPTFSLPVRINLPGSLARAVLRTPGYWRL